MTRHRESTAPVVISARRAAARSGLPPGLVAFVVAALSLGAFNRYGTQAPSPRSMQQAAAAAPAFPLRVAADGRHLEDARGIPFRIQSEEWVNTTAVTLTALDTYLQDRKTKGFNGFLMAAIVPQGGTYNSSRKDANGDEPFTTVGWLDTPNDVYFNFVSSIVDKAAAQGFVVQMFYTYAGYDGGDQGWWSVVNDPHNTQDVCFGWGQYLGNRFKDRGNLIWMAGGDYTMPAGEGLTRMHKILEGIRSAGAYQIAGSEWGSPDTLVTDQVGYTFGVDPHTSDLQLDSYYGIGPNGNGQTYDTAHRSWARSTPVLPGFIEEPVQAYSSYSPTDSSRASVRKYQHWSITGGGIAGGVWGIWGVASGWASNWQDYLNDPACIDQANGFAFYQALPWWQMRPSGAAAPFAGRDLIVAGAGSGDSQITASITSTGSHLIAYVPPTGTETRTFSVDLRSMAGNARARWWNPTTGTYLGIGANTYAFSNTLAAQSFTTSGDNGTGTNDWILLLDTAAGGTTGIPAVPALQCSPAAVVFAASILGLAGHAARRRAARG
jgi:hypothetical protein